MNTTVRPRRPSFLRVCFGLLFASIFYTLLPVTFLAAQNVTVSPASLSYGNQAVSTTSSAKTVTLKNGTTSALAISSITTAGDYAQTNTCGASVAAGKNCTISVTFTPTATGSRTGTLTITDTASNSPQTIPLTGNGVLQATLTPASLSLGSQAVGTTSVSKTAALKNNLLTALSVSSILVTGDFAQTSTCGSSLAAGTTCSINVTFTPTATGSRTGTLTVTDSASNSPQTVSLTGTGVVPVTVSPATLAFGNQAVTSTSSPKSVTVTNKQPTAVTISSITTPAAYSQTNTCGSQLPAQASCTVSVTFSPTTTGSQPGTLTITDNASNSPQTVNLSGTGTALPVITRLSPTSGVVGTSVTITGTGFGGSQGSSTITFNGIAATPTSWKATTIVAPVPTSATTGPVVVTVNGGSSNGITFTVVPTISNLSSSSGAVGTPITIAGSGFGSSQGTNVVTFNGAVGTPTSWSPNSIVVPVPSGATTGNVVVTVGGIASNGVPFTVQSAGFVTTTGQMATTRNGQTATRLANGLILVTGGMSSTGIVASAELYNPATQTFAAASSMNVARWLHTATLLNDGTVLIAGGSSSSDEAALNSAEVYDPVAGTFTLLANTLTTGRVGHTATLLSDGRVLIVGGFDPASGIIADSEIYDPTFQVFIDIGNASFPRFHHTATLLQTGKVLIAGGQTDPTPTGAYNNTEIFDDTTWTFSLLSGTMTSAREGHAATLLNDGTVLITGGNVPGTGTLNTAELFNPSTSAFTAVSASMVSPRLFQAANLLNGGKVLLSGGENDTGGTSVALNTAELYDPSAQTFTAASGSMASLREHQTATLLNDGTVIEIGGTDGTNASATAEIYTPSKLTGLTSISVSPAGPSVPLGTQQLLTATGTFSGGATQVLSSVLWSSSSTNIAQVSNDATGNGYVAAMAQGSSTITATAVGISGSANVTVPPPILTGITIFPDSPTLGVGTTQQLTATGVYSDGSLQDVTATATWMASPPAATVSSTGLVTGVSQGTSTVRATVGSQSGSTSVTVGPSVLISLALSPANSSIPSGASQQYQATATYSDGSTQNVTNSVQWSCLPCSAVSLDSSGLVTGIAQGTATIQAVLGTVSASAILTVTPANLTSLTVSPNSLSIVVGGTKQLSAFGTYSNYSGTDLTASSTWLSSNPAVATVSATGFVTALSSGTTIITATSGSASGSASLTVAASTGSVLNTGRYGQSATLLNNGMVLVAGGINCPTVGTCSYLTSAELYNPDTATSSNTSTLTAARSAPAVLLPNGKVLLAGGYSCDSSGNCASLSSAELFNMPYSYGYFTSGGNMTAPRSGHTVTLLNDGRVLIAGGQNCTSASSCAALNSAEIYDPASGTFAPTGNLNSARYNAIAVTLNQGLVLIAGGFDGSGYPATAELYDPTSGTFTSIASLNTPRANATATVLNSGRVLIAGGSNCATPGCPVSSVEQYDPVAGTFTTTPSLSVARFNHTATLLTNGQVLVTGGFSSCAATCTSEPTSELYDPIAGTFSSAQAMSTARAGQSAALLPSGDVVIAGGVSGGTTLSNIDFYQPSSLTPPGLTSIAVEPANPSIRGNVAQQLVAIGTFADSSTQTLRSAVWTSSNQAVTGITNDASGTGFVYPTTTGATAITANAGSVNGSTILDSTAFLTSLTVTPQYPILPVNQAQPFAARGTYSDGTSQDVTSSVTWTSSNTSVATVSSATPGLVNTLGGGTSVITATQGTITANTSLTVQAAAPSISSISPNSGAVGSYVGISGANFGSIQGNSFVTFNGVNATVTSWGAASIIVQVPTGTTSGPVQVTVGGNASNTIGFTLASQGAPTIFGLSQSIGVVGDLVTISGTGFEATGTVSFNGVAASTSSWSTNNIVAQIPPGAQTGPVTVSSGGHTSNGVTLTIVTPPSVTGVSPTSGDVGTVVTITGSNFATLQGGPVVLFNGTAVTPTNWTNNQIVVTVPKGARTGPLTVKVGNFSSNSSSFTIVPAGSQTLSISPATSTLAIGQTLNLMLNDDLEHNITGATWTLSDNTLAQLSSSDPPVFTALRAGQETVRAMWNGLTATAQITISAIGVQLPLGTVVCTLPPTTSGFTVQKMMQLVPSDGTSPELVAVEDDGQGSIWLRGVSSGCQQSWHTRVGSSGSGVDVVASETPDRLGGVIVMVSNNVNAGLSPSTGSLIRVDGSSGALSWRYDSPGALSGDIAIDQNGYILVVENYGQNGGYYTQSHLIKIDPNTGGQVASWNWPSSTFTQLPDGCGFGIPASYTYASGAGQVVVGPDGSYLLPIGWYNNVQWDVMTPGEISCAEYNIDGTTTGTNQLMTVSPSGSVSFTNLPNSPTTTSYGSGSGPGGAGNVIPDGNGGALVQYFPPQSGNQNQVSVQVIDIGGSNPTATISNFTGGDTVLGDQGTYFMTDGNQVVNVNEASGNELWRWQPASGSVQIIAATTGGGVAVRNIVGSQEDVVRLDASGNPSYDTWGASGGGSGYGVLANAKYIGNDQWMGQAASTLITGVIGTPVIAADDDPWAYSGGGPAGNDGATIGCPCLWQTFSSGGAQGAAQVSPANANIAEQPSTNEISALPQVSPQPQAAPPSGSQCPLCNLQPPQCLTVAGTQSTFVLIIGDPGLDGHNLGTGFALAAQQKMNDLQSQGHRVVACRASSAQDFDNALLHNGYIDGGVIYFGHGGPHNLVNVQTGETIGQVSILAVGEQAGAGTNVDYNTVSLLSNVNAQPQYPNHNILGTNSSILINGCEGGVNVVDYYANQSLPMGTNYTTSIAQQIANQTKRGVYAYLVGMYVSALDAAHDKRTAPAKGDLAPGTLPAYMVPLGTPGHKPNPKLFTPN